MKRSITSIRSIKLNNNYNNIINNNIKTIKSNEKKSLNERTNRLNPLGIQMISKSLRQQIFGSKADKSDDYEQNGINYIIRQLKCHGLDLNTVKQSSQLNDIKIEKHLPKLLDNDLAQHFLLLGQKFSDSYKRLSFNLIESPLLELPPKWVLSEGWTRYTFDTNGVAVTEKVDFPLENELIFDVEVCMNDSDGQKPTMATALSPKAWYSWCSRRLVECETQSHTRTQFDSKLGLKDLIPMGCALNDEKLIIGHNVSFDRSYIREQYDISADKTRFLDTMSLHMCISGLTQHQRALSYSNKIKENEESLKESDNSKNYSESVDPHIWSGVGSLNNLVDVYHLYCDNKQIISKDPRNIFIKGSIGDVFDSFQDLMTYCANDVQITYKIFKTIFPIFLERFPNPITFSGMLEMSIMYLPVVPNNWRRYLSECDSIYADEERELNLSLREIANDACSLAKDRQFTKDIWLWDLQWDTQEIRFKKPNTQQTRKTKPKDVLNLTTKSDETKDLNISHSLTKIFATSESLKKIQPFMPGYPKWYTEFCSKLRYDFSDDKEISAEDLEWESGPYRISTQMRSVPKLLRLMWNGFPVHFDDKHGWGYLKLNPLADNCPDRVPGSIDDNKNIIYFPFKEFKELLKNREKSNSKQTTEIIETDFEEIDFDYNNDSIQCYDDVIEGCLFFKLPHKGGPDKRVGNPLAKDFLKKVRDGSLTSLDSEIIDLVLQQNKRLSYWKNASKRVRSQIVVSSEDSISGAILPRVIVAGTVTRRAVEPTWLTASNVVTDRLGSELKSMIQCPEGYHFVGADVDSQELWIASLIGDSHFSGIHGSTGIGWMSLQGNKADGTDMHSKTAKSINITRDEAKVLNYARIYGSGQPFASRFLMQSQPSLSMKEAKEKAKKIFNETKGSRRKLLKDVSIGMKVYKSDEDNKKWNTTKRQWSGGTESHMFNKLEEIAESPEPRTPVLGCRISRALEPQIVKDYYITSRVNWVVQSSAVDFLHIMLVTMKWLMTEMEIEGRFSISIHDELRYLVKSEHKYSAALALQLSNLMTRSLFAYKLGLNDLPLSVAFFSAVDIDKCLRKEVNIDAKTPSNPLGLHNGYGIPFGESLDIFQLFNKINRK